MIFDKEAMRNVRVLIGGILIFIGLSNVPYVKQFVSNNPIITLIIGLALYIYDVVRRRN